MEETKESMGVGTEEVRQPVKVTGVMIDFKAGKKDPKTTQHFQREMGGRGFQALSRVQKSYVGVTRVTGWWGCQALRVILS